MRGAWGGQLKKKTTASNVDSEGGAGQGGKVREKWKGEKTIEARSKTVTENRGLGGDAKRGRKPCRILDIGVSNGGQPGLKGEGGKWAKKKGRGQTNPHCRGIGAQKIPAPRKNGLWARKS